MCAEKFLLVLMGGRAEGLACADPVVRTPICDSGNFFPVDIGIGIGFSAMQNMFPKHLIYFIYKIHYSLATKYALHQNINIIEKQNLYRSITTIFLLLIQMNELRMRCAKLSHIKHISITFQTNLNHISDISKKHRQMLTKAPLHISYISLTHQPNFRQILITTPLVCF